MSKSSWVAGLMAVGVVATSWGILLLPASAADAEDYAFQIPVTILNTSSVTFDSFACFDLSSTGLNTGGFIATDFLDAAAFTNAEVELELTRVDTGQAETCWWVETGSLSAGQSVTQFLQMGQVSTTTGDNPQSLVLDANTRTATTADDASLDIISNLTLELVDIERGGTEFPGGFVSVFTKGGSYELALGTGVTGADIRAVVTIVGGGCPGSLTATASTATVDANPHTLRATYLAAATSVLNVFLDEVLVATASTPNNCTISSGAGQVSLNAPAGEMKVGQARIGSGSIASPTFELDWTFEPITITQVREGNPANAWAWFQLIEDQSANSNDGTFDFTLDLSGIITSAAALSVKGASAFVQVEDSLPDQIGDLPDLTVSQATTVFTGDDFLDEVIDFAGTTTDGGFMLFIVGLASFLGGLIVLLTRQAFVGVIFLGGSVFVGGPLGWFDWGWVTIGTILCFGIAGFMAATGKR